MDDMSDYPLECIDYSFNGLYIMDDMNDYSLDCIDYSLNGLYIMDDLSDYPLECIYYYFNGCISWMIWMITLSPPALFLSSVMVIMTPDGNQLHSQSDFNPFTLHV